MSIALPQTILCRPDFQSSTWHFLQSTSVNTSHGTGYLYAPRAVRDVALLLPALHAPLEALLGLVLEAQAPSAGDATSSHHLAVIALVLAETLVGFLEVPTCHSQLSHSRGALKHLDLLERARRGLVSLRVSLLGDVDLGQRES